MKRILYIFTLLALTLSCRVHEMPLYNTPFVYLMTENGSDKATVGSDVDNVNVYYMVLSSASLSQNLVVDYKVTAGDGLKEGVDFSMETKGSSITFLPGINKMPLRIKWMPHDLDENKDNTLRLTLTGANMSVNLGFPGPDALNKELIITKKKL